MVTFGRLHHSRYNQELRMDLGHHDYIVRKDDVRPKGASPEQKPKTQRKKRR